jgi:bacillithiol biosynthesis cysteine-adding enzyme BshC
LTPVAPSVETPPLQRVPFDALHAFSPLFQHYTQHFDTLAGFYAGDFQQVEARRAAAERAATWPRDREMLVAVLLEQNARWGMDAATRANIEALRHPEAVAVVTGQQVGLFTGPPYTPYKTITTLQLARQMAAETGRPVVPVFWLEGEDHDFDEVASVTVLQGNDPVRLTYAGVTRPEHGNVGPVGRLVLTEAIHSVLEALEVALPPTAFKPDLLAQVQAAYAPGTTLLDAFARLMRAFFPDQGLVFIDPDDPRLKRLVAPLFRKALETPDTAAARLAEASARLTPAFHVQVQPHPTYLFLFEPEGRFHVETGDAAFHLKGLDRAYTREDLLALVDTAPARFSPNVVLRPLVQDMLLPTAAYVAGPAEVAYFGQYRELYEWAGVPMPLIYPRASVTLVEPKVQKVLERYHLSLGELTEETDKLFRRLVLESLDLEAPFGQALGQVHTALDALLPVVERVDRSLHTALEATRTSLLKELDRLRERVVKAQKRQQEDLRDQLVRTQTYLMPEGRLQERTLSLLYFLNKYGPELMIRLQDRLSLDTAMHQVLSL